MIITIGNAFPRLKKLANIYPFVNRNGWHKGMYLLNNKEKYSIIDNRFAVKTEDIPALAKLIQANNLPELTKLNDDGRIIESIFKKRREGRPL